MKRHVCRILSCCFLWIFLSADGLTAESGRNGSALLVVPARYRVLQLAADMNRLRSADIVSYRGDAGSTQPLLHLWTGTGWQPVGMAEFAAGGFLRQSPGVAILVGDDNVIPSVLLENVAWRRNVERVETLLISDLINGLDRLFEFTEEEWKQLAHRYELKLTDVRARARSINPYAIRRSELPVEAPAPGRRPDDVGPAILMKEREVEGLLLIEEVITERP